jgi:hypothetical protein
MIGPKWSRDHQEIFRFPTDRRNLPQISASVQNQIKSIRL